MKVLFIPEVQDFYYELEIILLEMDISVLKTLPTSMSLIYFLI